MAVMREGIFTRDGRRPGMGGSDSVMIAIF